VPKDGQNKLDSKARKCVFLGYGNEVKGHRLYDMQTKTVFYSRDVLFNEVNQEDQKLTNASKPPEEKQYVSIEYLNDDEHDAESEVESLLQRSTRQRRPLTTIWRLSYCCK